MQRLPAADPTPPTSRTPTRYLGWLVRRAHLTIVAAVLLAVVWMGFQSLVPSVIGRAVDAAAARDPAHLFGWAAVLLAVGVLEAMVGITRHRFATMNWLGASFRTVRVAVRQAGRLGSALPRRLDAGEVVAIGTSDIGHIGAAIDITTRGTGALIAVTVVTVLLIRTSVPLGLVVLIGVPVLLAVVSGLIRPLHRRQQEYRVQQGRLTGQAADLVAGLRVLRGVGGEAVMAEHYRAESQELRWAGVRTASIESLLEAAQVLLPGVFLVLVTWIGARLALRHEISIGELVSFYAYAAFLVTPVRQLTEAIDKLTRGHVSARRVVDMLGVPDDLPDPPVPQPAPRGDLADPETGVVVTPGRITAIVATEPAEAALVAERLGRYAEGATLGGVPLCELALPAIRERILVAGNEDRLFSGTLRRDLDPDDRGTLGAALTAAAADEIVAGLPDGTESTVAERGRSFSGGQQQRLRLARALVADPEILVLVEPTNAVDAHTEARIAESLRSARAGRTTVICTTSPLVLDRADRVLFLAEGRVAATGTHRELLESVPGYARVVVRGDRP
ncbi:ABC transporter ATP-binding protein [Actinoplanes sp. NPDC051851]|uniref:ABC transporter ATP-binding protein n=1 Tax=Actinoplanes sp. NPDC051851 TaxID=3154753 RepID=UPI00343CD942